MSFLTPPVSVSGFQNYQLKGFADATNIKTGKHEIEIILHYSEKSSSTKGFLEVSKQNSMIMITAISTAIIIILTIAGIIIYKKRKNVGKQTNKKSQEKNEK